MKVGFLFNHDALHQISHTAPVIPALLRYPGVEVRVLTSSDEQAARVRALIGAEAAARVRFVPLAIGRGATTLDRVLRFVAPFRRVATLWQNRAAFAEVDVLVVPETTSLLLRERMGLHRLKFVWIPHGAGDRSVGFRSVARQFDLVLLSGNKVRDRMLDAGLVTPDSYRIIGYPKFDTIRAGNLPRLFADDRPTVLYNPHFDPRLSSWYRMGPAILDWFAGQSRFDLVFAPHVMLFQRRIHASVEHRQLHWRPDVAERHREEPHMIIDQGSERSVDMTYTRGADIYIGDASSQVYEWIARPRPAIFINAARLDWHDDPNFAHWHLGEVVETIDQLASALDRAAADPHRFDAAQRAAFAATFDQTSQPAADRAAAAIVEQFS